MTDSVVAQETTTIITTASQAPVNQDIENTDVFANISTDVEKTSDDGNSPSIEKSSEEGKSTEGKTEEENIVPMNRLQFWTLSLAMALSILVVALDDCIVATAIPRITDQFNSLADVGWYGSGYLMTMACFQLTCGKLYKHFPAKWVLLGCIAVFEIGSAVCASAPSSRAFITGRAIAGVGASGIYSGVLIIIAQVVPIRQRAIFTSAVGSIHGVAAVCGPILGGVLTDSYLTWRWCFWINLPLGVFVILIILFLFHPKPIAKDDSLTTLLDRVGVLDPLGLFFFTGAILCLFLSLSISGAYGWGFAAPIVLIVFFGVLLVIYAGVQWWLGERGSLPPRLIGKRNVIFSCGYSFMIDSSYYVAGYFLPVWFQAVKLLSARDSGFRLIPVIIASIIFSLLSGIVVAKTGHFAPVIFLSSLIAAIGCGLLTIMTPASGPAEWVVFPALVGAGVGLGMQQGAVVVQNGLEEDDIPTAISAAIMFQMLGSATMLSIAQSVFAAKVYQQLHDVAPDLTRAAIFNTGATELIALAGPGQHDVFVKAINKALTQCFFVSTAAASLAGVFGFGLGFKKMPA